MLSMSPRTGQPWLAAALSMLCAGLGQVYCGRVRRGLVMFGVTVLFGPAVMLIVLLRPSIGSLLLLLASMFVATVVSLGSIVDALRLARRAGDAGRKGPPRVLWLMAVTGVPATLGLAVWLRGNVVEAFYLPSSSMAPTLVKGDRFLADKTNATTRAFQRGDLVVFKNPENREQRFVKRVLGLAGDTVELRGGTVFINGEALRREPVDGAPAANEAAAFYEWNGDRRYQVLVSDADENAEMPPLTVPENSYFVMGDHRGLSFDSRRFGPVSQADFVGIVAWIYAPAESWDRFGVVE